MSIFVSRTTAGIIASACARSRRSKSPRRSICAATSPDSTVKDLAQWNGQLFAQLDYTDIAAWRSWVKFPVYVPHGVGAVRVWAELKHGELAEIIADVQSVPGQDAARQGPAGTRTRCTQGPRRLEANRRRIRGDDFQARHDDPCLYAAADGFAAALSLRGRRQAVARRIAGQRAGFRAAGGACGPSAVRSRIAQGTRTLCAARQPVRFGA